MCERVCDWLCVQAQDVMMERQGVATHLLYQLYVALQRKTVRGAGEGRWSQCKTFVPLSNPLVRPQKQHLTGQSLRCMKPTGKSLLESVEKSVFQGVRK